MNERCDDARVRRHTVVVRVEHWTVTLSGLVLLFTGIGQLPMYQRYGLTKIPGLGWSGDFLLNLTIHYVAAALFMAAMVFHLVYHGLLRETAALPRRGDVRESWRIVRATLGFGEEPPSGKFLAEQRLAYAVIGGAALLLSLTGVVKIAKTAAWVALGPTAALVNTTLHNLGFVVFFLALLAHLAAFLLRANRPLLPSMVNGTVDRAYAERRHGLWLTELEGCRERAP